MTPSKKSKGSKKKITTRQDQYIFRKGINIGNLDAESDRDFLEKAFVEKNELEYLTNISSSQCILVGRTGTGKTAFLKNIENNTNTKFTRIEPESMSLMYLSNSTILGYFEKLDIKLDLFYKTLWKHVLIVELLKLYCGSDEHKERNMFQYIKDRITGKQAKRKQAQDYLDKWTNTFWQNTEVKIKEMEQTISKKLSDAFEIKAPKPMEELFKIVDNYEKTHDERMRSEVLQKSQSVINDMHAQDISDIIEVMKEDLFLEKKGKYFILIDDLDKEWVDNKIVYDLIKAMIDAIKELNAIPGTKIIIALRDNLLKIVLKRSNSRGNQREKYDGMLLRIEWIEDELRELVEKRLEALFKEKYSSKSPKIEDVFKWNVGRENIAFSYILERTLMRPRDVIDYVNKCLMRANGKTEINSESIKSAEREYSNGRLIALIDEWSENYPVIDELIDLIKSQNEVFSFTDFKTLIEERVSSLIMLSPKFKDIKVSNNLSTAIEKYKRDMEIDSLLKSILTIFYEIGLIGAKFNPELPYEFSSQESSIYHREMDIEGNTKFIVHKTFHRALNIDTRSQS